MGAPSEYYVDPGLGSDLNSGTVGSPWGTVQHALDNITRDSTNGDRINIKTGTDVVLSSASLDISTYGIASVDAPLIFQGYSSAAGDGGIGGISGNGTRTILANAPFSETSIVFRDMHLHNTGTANIFNVGIFLARFINCEFDNTTASASASAGKNMFLKCHFHNIGTNAIRFSNGLVRFCYFHDDGINTMDNAIFQTAIATVGPIDISYNIFSLSGGNGILIQNWRADIHHNSFLSNGSGTALEFSASSSSFDENDSISDNLFEEWAMSIDISSDTTTSIIPIHHNAAYNASYNIGDAIVTKDNETLGSSPFSKSGSDTFANRATYFAPVNVGNVFSPSGGVFKAKGAVQL